MKRLAAAAMAAAGLHLLLFSLERDPGGLRNTSPPAAVTVTISLAAVPLPPPPSAPPAVPPPDPPAVTQVPQAPSPATQTVAPAAGKTPSPAGRPVPRAATARPAEEAATAPAPQAPERPLSDATGDHSRPPAENQAPPFDATQEPAAASGPVGALRPPAAPVLESATPYYDRNPPPDYPRRARQLGFEGTVLLDVAVNAQGGVDAVAVAASSGYAMLDEAALGAVRHWIFKPARQEGRPVADRVLVPVRFVLSASSAAGK